MIVLSFVECSTAQSDDENGWWDARDYYNQFVNSKDSNSYDSLFLVLFFVVIVGAIIWNLTHRTKERRYFSAEVKRQVLQNQNCKCEICKRNTGVWDYDHKNGDRSNNKLSNCQALCPNCHAKKTRGLLKSKMKSSRKLLKLFFISLIIIVVIFFFY
jgi:predicted HNH restriction endonuclease